MKDEVPFGGVGGGSAGVRSSLQGQAVLLILLRDRAPACESLRWCRGAVQLQQACRSTVQSYVQFLIQYFSLGREAAGSKPPVFWTALS